MRAGQASSCQLSEVRPRSGNSSKNVPPANSTISRTPSTKPGNGKADQHDHGGGGVEARALAHRLGDAERNRNQVRRAGTSRAPRLIETGSFSLMSCHTGLICEEAAAEIETREVPEHLEIAHVGGLVEAVQLLQFLDLLRVDVAACLVGAARRGRCALPRGTVPTGPPGTNWITTNVTVSAPSSVGTMSRMRLRT